MTAILHGGVYLPPGSGRDLLPWRRTNPSWAWWNRSKRGDEPPRYVFAGRELPVDGPWARGLALPRYDSRSPATTIDRSTFPAAPVLEHQRQLRDYQRRAVGAWQSHGSGVLQLPCGAGKTTIGLSAIASTPTPALVLMHTLDLVNQWASRVHDELGVAPVIATEGRRPEPGRVTLATVQTLARWSWWDRAAWGRGMGLLIVDEAHHTPASTFVDVVLSMPCLMRLGLTATPERADGLTEWLWWHLGPVRYQVSQADLQREGSVLVPELRTVQTGWTPATKEGETLSPDQVRRQRMRSKPRNQRIADEVAQLVAGGHQVLVLADQVPHVEALAKLMDAVALHGELGDLERRARLEGAALGSCRVLVATSVADEGLDLPSLSALVLAVPSAHQGRVEQRIGRVLRPQAGKLRPVVLDLLDDDEASVRARKVREVVYRKLGCASG